VPFSAERKIMEFQKDQSGAVGTALAIVERAPMTG
jgi:hypothetical protein